MKKMKRHYFFQLPRCDRNFTEPAGTPNSLYFRYINIWRAMTFVFRCWANHSLLTDYLFIIFESHIHNTREGNSLICQYFT